MLHSSKCCKNFRSWPAIHREILHPTRRSYLEHSRRYAASESRSCREYDTSSSLSPIKHSSTIWPNVSNHWLPFRKCADSSRIHGWTYIWIYIYMKYMKYLSNTYWDGSNRDESKITCTSFGYHTKYIFVLYVKIWEYITSKTYIQIFLLHESKDWFRHVLLMDSMKEIEKMHMQA